jgi:polyisoprenoid-binding protein YceI
MTFREEDPMSVATQAIPTGTYTDDGIHSSIGFEVKHMVVATFRGRFDEYKATLTVDENGDAKLVGIVQTDSVLVKDENLAGHLQSPDFFDAEAHPDLRFTAEDVDISETDVSARGEITIKGVSRPVEVTGTATAPLVDPYGNDRIGLRLTAAVDRTEFGVSWNNPLPSGQPALADEVRIVTDLQFVRAS